MYLSDLKRIWKEAPESGQLLAYTRRDVHFRSYGDLIEVKELLEREELVELHLFDDEKEYRCLASRSGRFLDGVIEAVADFGEDKVYKESSLLSNQDRTGDENMLTILNHISYDPDNGMAYIDNYRLKMGGR